MVGGEGDRGEGEGVAEGVVVGGGVGGAAVGGVAEEEVLTGDEVVDLVGGDPFVGEEEEGAAKRYTEEQSN